MKQSSRGGAVYFLFLSRRGRDITREAAMLLISSSSRCFGIFFFLSNLASANESNERSAIFQAIVMQINLAPTLRKLRILKPFGLDVSDEI